MKNTGLTYGAIFVIFIITETLFAQDLTKDVYVVKPYKPAVSVASKINELPVIKDTLTVKPTVQYYVIPFELATAYTHQPIKAAKLTGNPISKLYGNYVRIGMGNYVKPMGEVFISNTRNKNFSWGTHVFDEASFGKIKLANNKKVYAGYNDAKANVYGKYIFDKAVIIGDLDLVKNTVHHYGYNTSIDTILDKKEIRQNFTDFTASTRIHSSELNDSSVINYDINAKYKLFTDVFDYNENCIDLSADLSKYYRGNKIGLLSGLKKYSEDIDSLSQSIFSIKPFISRYGKEFDVFAGIDLSIYSSNNTSSFHPYPIGYIEYNGIDHYTKPYIGVSGKFEINNYSKLATENPFIKSGLVADPTDNSIILFGGFRGNYSPKLSYNFKYSYSVINQMYFYVNDTSSILMNTFDVVYDDNDVEVTNYFGEVNFRSSDKLAFFLRGNYFNYNFVDQAKPWHKPSWDLSLTMNYNIQDKIFINSGIIAISKRYFNTFNNIQPIGELKEIIDLNLGIDYKYSKVITAFLKLNNLTGSRYYRWNLYPMQRFNMMLGVSYCF